MRGWQLICLFEFLLRMVILRVILQELWIEVAIGPRAVRLRFVCLLLCLLEPLALVVTFVVLIVMFLLHIGCVCLFDYLGYLLDRWLLIDYNDPARWPPLSVLLILTLPEIAAAESLGLSNHLSELIKSLWRAHRCLEHFLDPLVAAAVPWLFPEAEHRVVIVWDQMVVVIVMFVLILQDNQVFSRHMGFLRKILRKGRTGNWGCQIWRRCLSVED